MVTLELSNTHVRIEGARRRTIRALDKVTSYKVEGAQFVKAFQRGFWDGREHLLTYSVKRGYRAPIGLAEDIVAALDERGERFRIVDKRRIHGERRRLRWSEDVTPRPYQREANRAILRDTTGQPLFGCGLLKMPIRSGKTKTLGTYIHALGYRTLIIVPSQMLLHQTVASMQECFPDEHIGIIGDEQCDIQWITVATIQTLQRWRNRQVPVLKKNGEPRMKGKKPVMKHEPDPRYTELTRTVDILPVDEAHHLRGDSEWHMVVNDFRARFRVALSATAYLDSEVEQGRGIIWLKACMGPMRIDISESRLIREGYLMPQNVRMFRLDKPTKWRDWKWSVSLQREAIWTNEARNARIAEVAKMFVDKGMRTLIVTTRLEHTAHLSETLWGVDINHETITGKDSRHSRNEKVDEFANGGLRLLVGTVLGEGVDIPECEVVIIAAGGRDAKNTMQRMRNMTVSEGKNLALLIDFVDDINPYLLEHSMERLKVYQATPEFTVEVVG